MQCLKCGRNIELEQVFCADCLAEMEKYPVKPGTVVHIPHRPPHSPVKKAVPHRHPSVSPEEQVKKLKKRVAALSFALILTISALAAIAWQGWKHFMGHDSGFLPGQNYSSAASTGPDAPD